MENEDLVIGVAAGDIDLHKHPEEELAYYGYICCAGKKVGPEEESSNYGDFCALNDRVGVLLEFSKNEASVSFFRNNKNLGVAFPSIPLNTYYPAVTMYCGVLKVTLNSTAPVPLSS